MRRGTFSMLLGVTMATMMTDVSLRANLDEWCANSTAAESEYGPLGSWDTSQVTNMSYLIYSLSSSCRSSFNEDTDTNTKSTARMTNTPTVAKRAFWPMALILV